VSAPGSTGEREPLGSAAQEATRLAEALQAWWVRHEAAAPDQGEPDGPDVEADGAGGPRHPHGQGDVAACRYCPLCRALASAQAVRPEVVQHLVSAAASVAAALRELAREDAPSGSGQESHSAAGGGPRTVRIPVDDGDPHEAEKGG
jgi:hypothetical protein